MRWKLIFRFFNAFWVPVRIISSFKNVKTKHGIILSWYQMKYSKEKFGVARHRGPHFPGEVCMVGPIPPCLVWSVPGLTIFSSFIWVPKILYIIIIPLVAIFIWNILTIKIRKISLEQWLNSYFRKNVWTKKISFLSVNTVSKPSIQRKCMLIISGRKKTVKQIIASKAIMTQNLLPTNFLSSSLKEEISNNLF